MAQVSTCCSSLNPVVIRKGHDGRAVSKGFRMPSASRPELAALRMASRSRSGAVRTVTTASLPSSRPGESVTETLARRFGESVTVAEKALLVKSPEQLEAFLVAAEDKLVMLHIESDEECDLGDDPDVWATETNILDGTHTSMNACVQLKNNLARVVRDADDVVFLDLSIVGGDSEMTAFAKDLGVDRFPTCQYYKNGRLVWQHVGASSNVAEKIGEGVLFHSGQAAHGLNANEYVTPVQNEADFSAFLESCTVFPRETPFGVTLEVPCTKQLAVLDVSLENNSAACMHVYPAVLGLARNTEGATRWARLLGDSSPEANALLQKFGVTSAPTFIFFSDGKEVKRYVGADRMELMNQVLQFQEEQGVKLPQRAPRKRMTNAEARALAIEERKKQRKKNPFYASYQ